MKEMLNHYWKPTPKKWRRFGDGLLAGSTLLSVGGLWQFDSLKDVFTAGEIKGLIITSIILGVVGKFLTNFFKEDTPENN